MRFLLQLFSRCVSWLQRKGPRSPSKSNPDRMLIPRVLAPDELVTRYIYSERNIRKSEKRPKRGAFDPSPHMELSVVHSSGLTETEVWELGEQTKGSTPGRRNIYARADIPVQTLMDVKLRALRDDKPFIRHTSVIDWPLGSDGNEAKALWLQICLELSEDHRIRLEFPVAPAVHS
jgi:hypothetical protein